MACYKRIYYIDYCDNGGRQTNAGFIKLVQWKKGEDGRGEGTCLQVYISGFTLNGEVAGEVKVTCGFREILLGQVMIVSGKGIAQVACLEEVLAALERKGRYETILLRVELTADRYLECVLKEAAEVPSDQAALEVAEVVEEMTEERPGREMQNPEGDEPALSGQREQEERQEDECRSISEPPQQRDLQPPARDKWQQLWAFFPHICPFEDQREYLKMDLKDLMILPNTCYRVIENSFLLHGYYNFEHLILIKIHKKGRERCFVGVPGNYYEREAQVAVMFGFESFEPKEEPPKEGDFGYYLIGVEI